MPSYTVAASDPSSMSAMTSTNIFGPESVLTWPFIHLNVAGHVDQNDMFFSLKEPNLDLAGMNLGNPAKSAVGPKEILRVFN